MKSKYLYSLILLLVIPLRVVAQYDTIHYVPPFFAVENVDEQYVYLSTNENTTFSVSITDGSGHSVANVSISDTTPQRYFLGQGYAGRGPITRDSLNKILTYDGLVLQASEPFFVNIRHKQSAQGLSLTTKGSQALGTLFRTGHVFNNGSVPNVKGHTISVMASVDNTTVTFSDISSGVVFWNTPTSGTPLTSDNITITLSKGESYVIGTRQSDALATNNQNDVNGTLVSSDKPIAVNTGSWLGGGHGGNRDIGVDQIVPYELIGREYIFVKGNGNSNTERPLVVAISDGTEIFINNNVTPFTTLNTGEYVFLPESTYSANDNMYVYSPRNFYMYQSMSGTSTAAVGMIFIPPLNCVGGDEVTIPEVEQLGSSTISITAISGSPVYINGTQISNSQPVLGNSDWVTYKVDSLIGDVTVSSNSKINVALLTTEGARGAAGYFSGFRPSIDVSSIATNYIEFVLPNTVADTLVLNQNGPFTSITYTFLLPQNGGTIILDSASQNKIPYTYVPAPGYVGFDYVTFQVCKDFVCANGNTLSNCANYTMTIRVLGPEDCSNSLDDDQDGLVDCADPDCLSAISNVVTTEPTCINKTGGQIFIQVIGDSGTFTYSITNEANYMVNPIFSNLGIGQYTVRIRKDNGCEETYLNNPIIFDMEECLEICNDGIDNDGDGKIDCDDTDCNLFKTPNQIIDN